MSVCKAEPLAVTFTQLNRLLGMREMLARPVGDSTGWASALFLRLEPSVDLRALALAAGLTRARHEALRATFCYAHEPHQHVAGAAASASVPEVLDLCSGAGPHDVAAILSDFASQPLDLAGEGGFAWDIVSAGNELYMVLRFDHLICDAASIRIVVQELDLNYATTASGARPTIEPAKSYVAHASEERAWLESESGRESLAKLCASLTRLGGFPTLPIGGSSPPGRFASTSSQTLSMMLPPDVTPLFRQACQQNRATPTMVVLTCLRLGASAALQEPVPVVIPTVNRFSADERSMVGWLSDLMVVDGGGPEQGGEVAEGLIQLRGMVTQALKHRHASFYAGLSRVAPDQFGRLRKDPWLFFGGERRPPSEDSALRNIPGALLPAMSATKAPNALHVTFSVEPDGLRLNGTFPTGVIPEEQAQSILDATKTTLIKLCE